MSDLAPLLGKYGITGVEIPPAPLPSGPNEPARDVARLFPPQGKWTAEQYLELTEVVNWPIEFEKGFIEFLPTPTIEHQLIVKFLLMRLNEFVEAGSLGEALFGPLPTWLDSDRYREPDLLFVTKDRHAQSDKVYRGADVAMEVVGDDPRSRERDYVQMRELYAAAGIAEYWIVDPQEQQIMILALEGDKYTEHEVAKPGAQATSRLLTGFAVDVAAVFAAGKKR